MLQTYLWRVQTKIQQGMDLLFPPPCALCQKLKAVLCEDCLHNVQRGVHERRCGHCYSLLDTLAPCSACAQQRVRLSGLRAVGSHQGTLRACIIALKYKGQKRLAEPLGDLLAQTYHLYGMQADYLLPMPLHKDRQRLRGYNQSTLLARSCATQLGLPLLENMLEKPHATASQVDLTESERRQNVSGAFHFVPGVTTRTIFKRRIIIIDDVCTTGATLEACAGPLFAAGAESVWGLVLARTNH